jgi:branched-chain amino acid transport system ATP-binding protein
MSGPGARPNSTGDVLEVRHLSARIAGQAVVEDVSFTVPATGVTAVLGRNGVGKTSTLRAILGLVDRRGEVLFAGARIDNERTDRIVRRGIGYVPEDRDVFAGLTVAENLRLAERDARDGAGRRQLVSDLFPDLVRRAGQRAGTLSGGQQQMVSLARALLNENRLLLVDEPTKGLAPKLVGEVADALAEAATRVPILLVEQNLEVVDRLAERVVVIDAGRVVHTGPARALLDDPAHVQRLLGVHADGNGGNARTAGHDDAPSQRKEVSA